MIVWIEAEMDGESFLLFSGERRTLKRSSSHHHRSWQYHIIWFEYGLIIQVVHWEVHRLR